MLKVVRSGTKEVHAKEVEEALYALTEAGFQVEGAFPINDERPISYIFYHRGVER
jgi:hypothetical protein